VISLYSFELERPPGRNVYRTKSLGETAIPSGTDGIPYTATIGDVESARILQITKGKTRLRVALDLSPLQHWEKNMWRAYFILVPATVVLLAIGGSWFYRKAMKPVDEIAAAADRITAERLEQRLPVSGVRDEIGHLTEVLNRMINRLQQSFGQARRFSADASHELKTPLTILRGELEGLLRSGQLPDAAEKTVISLLDETGRLEHIVQGLLLLSQADSGRLPISEEVVDLSELVEESTGDIEILAEKQSITVESKVAPAVLVKGSSQFLRQLVLNLCDNALKYNRRGGAVRIGLSTGDGTAVFLISNTGTTIAPEHRERIFDRFYRAESSLPRELSRGGQGLGLSICREIVRAHGGTLTIEPSEPGWNTFQFTLPLHLVKTSAIPGGDRTRPVSASQG
jgi:signal transduction histidine kinase